jgi:branched-chain amino acid transport system substrate-binding protein
MKLGVLYPRSKVYPDITTDFTNGLKSYLKKEQINESIELQLESIGFGGSEKEVYEKVEKLMLIDEVDMVVAYIDEKVIGILQPLLQATGKLLLVVNSGANYPETPAAQPNIIRLNLQNAFLCHLAGELAGQQKDNTALVASSFFDCGYLHLAAMVRAFSTKGGQVVFNYINKQQPDEIFDIPELANFLNAEGRTGNLLCVYGTSAAASLYELLNERDDADSLHLFVSPMMLEPAAMEKTGEGCKLSIDGYLPWMASSTNGGNIAFCETIRQQTKKEPSLFSLLGWESAMVVKEIFMHCKEHYADADAIAAKLENLSMNGPRGEIMLDKETHQFIAPYFKFSSRPNDQPVIEQVPFTISAWENYNQQPTGGVHSGWTNTYLCY